MQKFVDYVEGKSGVENASYIPLLISANPRPPQLKRPPPLFLLFLEAVWAVVVRQVEAVEVPGIIGSWHGMQT